MNRWLLCSVLVILCACQASATLPQGELRGCGPTLRLDIVSTPTQRQQGLMGVTTLPAQYGMLFVFPYDTQPTFWMRDTLVALDVIFMRSDGTITQIEAMQPRTDTEHTALQPIRYALETPQGWMQAHGVTVGQQCVVDLPQLTVE